MLPVNLALFIPFIAAMCIPFIYRRISRLHLGWFVIAIPTIVFISLLPYIKPVANGETYIYIMRWIPSFDIQLLTYVDGLSLLFGLLITGIGVLVTLYSIYYLSKEESLPHFYIYLLLFMGSMLGVVFSDHLIGLYVFWELTSISSFLLIAFWYHRKGSRYGAKKSLLITITGGFAMLIGFIMLHVITDSYSIREIISNIGAYTDHALFIPAMILILLGAFSKSAQFPFHIWLPDAMEAPTPVSAYLHSATMVKAGIYLVARLTPIFASEILWFYLISGIGLMTLLWGSFTAIRQTDLKALLAYSTVSQLGLIMSLIGIGSLAYVVTDSASITLFTQAGFAAVFHLVNHSTFKGALFMIVGIVDFQVGTRDIRRLGGLVSLMPISFTIAFIGSFSMAGLPPFNGFLSKEMFFSAMLHVQQADIFSAQAISVLFPVIAWIASLFTFMYCLIIVFKTFFGNIHVDEERIASEPQIGMLLSPAILAMSIIGIFFLPNGLQQNILLPASGSIYPGMDLSHLATPISWWHGFNMEIVMTIGIIVFGTVLFLGLRYFMNVYKPFPTNWSLDTLYNSSLHFMETSAAKITQSYMTGYLRDYFRYIFVFLITVVLSVLFYTGAFSFSLENDRPIHVFEGILASVMIIAAIMILFAKSRLSAILFNGLLGFSIAMFFVLFRAPDLALTQLVIETVTTALFLLCFYFLPTWVEKDTDRTLNIPNLLISLGVGTTFVLIALSVHNGKLVESIATFFEKADELAGGENIVNSILADFRAFDTMLEVVVLFIAGIGVYTLIKLKHQREVDK